MSSNERDDRMFVQRYGAATLTDYETISLLFSRRGIVYNVIRLADDGRMIEVDNNGTLYLEFDGSGKLIDVEGDV